MNIGGTVTTTGTTEAELARQLGVALYLGGYKRLTQHKREPSEWLMNAGGLLFVGAGVAALAAPIAALGAPLWVAATIGIVVVTGFVVIASLADLDDEVTGWIFIVFVGASAAVQALVAGWLVLRTTVAPIALAALAMFLIDRFDRVTVTMTLEAVKSALTSLPLLFPLISLVIFALILTTEIWEASSQEGAVQIAALGVVVIIPVVLVLLRQLIRQIDDTVKEAARAVKRLGDKQPREVIARVRRTAGRSAEQWVSANASELIAGTFTGISATDEAEKLCKKLRGTFKRRIAARLFLMVLSVAIVGFLVIYGLTWLLVDDSVAAKWSGVAIDHGALGIPLGPYIKVSALLALLATAIFVAFIVTTDSVEEEFRKAYIQEPATTALLLVIPYDDVAKPLDESR
jgi:hypothetical protein